MAAAPAGVSMGATAGCSEDWPKDWFERVDHCLWCGSADLEAGIHGARDWFFRAVPGTFDFDRCRQCGSLVLRKRPDADHIGLAYRGYYTHTAAPRTAPASEGGAAYRLRRSFANGYTAARYAGSERVIDRIAAALYRRMGRQRHLPIDINYHFMPPPPARVLDYGCGNGDFLRFASELGHDTMGVDFDEDAVAAAASTGHTLVCTPDAIGAQGLARFDFINAAHVIEHVPDPRALLFNFYQWLNPGATLYLELPRAECEGLARYGRYWRGLEAPRHFSLPSAAALDAALGEAGFRHVELLERVGISRSLWPQSQLAMEADGGTLSDDVAIDASEGDEFLTIVACKPR